MKDTDEIVKAFLEKHPVSASDLERFAKITEGEMLQLLTQFWSRSQMLKNIEQLILTYPDDAIKAEQEIDEVMK